MIATDYKTEVDATLNALAKRLGKGWKDKLRLAWYDGNYHRIGCDAIEAAELQSIRNSPLFGHEYLATFKPEK